jgi:hypothetical protein
MVGRSAMLVACSGIPYTAAAPGNDASHMSEVGPWRMVSEWLLNLVAHISSVSFTCVPCNASLSVCVARTEGDTCAVKVWALCLVLGPFSVAPCHPNR